MTGVTRFGVSLIGAAVMAFGVQAQEAPQLVQKIGNWDLYYSKALGDSCFAMQVDAEGRQFQVGVDRVKQQAYAGLFAKAAAGATDGKTVDLTFDLGDKKFSGTATQYNKGGTEGGYVYFNNLDFAYELAKQQTLKIIRPAGDPVMVDLTGSADAIAAVIDCQIATAQ